MLDETEIEEETLAEFLGLYLDHYLTRNCHFDSISTK